MTMCPSHCLLPLRVNKKSIYHTLNIKCSGPKIGPVDEPGGQWVPGLVFIQTIKPAGSV